VPAIGRHAPDHLAADDFIAADVATVEGTNTIIEQIADLGGVDVIVHVAGGGASAPAGGFASSPHSFGTRRWSSTFWERYASTAA